jgi:hypothetical protein
MTFLQQFGDAQRFFQYDYIYIDALFLIIWIFFLIKNKKEKALIFSIIIAPIIYSIDAMIWWNTSAGPGFSVGTFIREYWIGGVQMPHPLGEFFWIKFGADFMMTISYAIFAFSWIWIMFESIRKKVIDNSSIIKYTSVYFIMWILVPLLSYLVPINDIPVVSVRHMSSQITSMVMSVVVGYLLLIMVYRKELFTVFRVFLVGVSASLIMEIPLHIFGIRPTGILFVLFEALLLLNIGTPYLFLLWDKLLYPHYKK